MTIRPTPCGIFLCILAYDPYPIIAINITKSPKLKFSEWRIDIFARETITKIPASPKKTPNN